MPQWEHLMLEVVFLCYYAVIARSQSWLLDSYACGPLSSCCPEPYENPKPLDPKPDLLLAPVPFPPEPWTLSPLNPCSSVRS